MHFTSPFFPFFFLILNSTWHQLGHMLRTWARTKIVGTNIQDRGVWAELLYIFWLRYAAGLSGKLNRHFLSLLSPSPVSCGVFFFYSPCLLTLWQPESSWIVREECLFVLPTCCHCEFDCLSRQRGLRHNHSHTVTPVDGHYFWQGSQMVLHILCGAAIRQSDWLTSGQSMKFGGPLQGFLSCQGFKLIEKCFEYKLKFVALLKQV